MSANPASKSIVFKRDTGIDLLRALTMFIMIFVNDFWKIHDVPRWMEHAKFGEDFLGLSDVVFPIFLFVVGMSIPPAIEKRFSKGLSVESTLGHIFSRTAALLVMGAFIVNSEERLSPGVSYSIGVYWILMVTGFMLIWNQYPSTTNKKQQTLHTILKMAGLMILLYLAITFRDPKDGVFSARWWGILGAIGWSYLFCAFVYLFTRSRLNYLIPVWIVLVFICMLGSRLNDAHGGQAILQLPRPNFYSDVLGIFHIGNGALSAFTMGGIIFTLLKTKYMHLADSRKTIYLIVAIILFLLAGTIAHQFWIVSKLSATPTWIFYVTAIAIGIYSLLSWLSSKEKAGWLNVIKPAGTATLTCYLLPYISYALADLTGIVLPDWLTHGFMGIVNCLGFSLIIIGATWLLGRIPVKLKI